MTSKIGRSRRCIACHLARIDGQAARGGPRRDIVWRVAGATAAIRIQTRGALSAGRPGGPCRARSSGCSGVALVAFGTSGPGCSVRPIRAVGTRGALRPLGTRIPLDAL